MRNPHPKTVAALLAGCLLATGGAASAARHRQPEPTQRSAVAFLAQTIRRIAANDYAAVWPNLYPPQRRAIPKAQYVACESAEPVVGQLRSLTPLKVRRLRIHVAGGPRRRVNSVAVTFRIIANPDPASRLGVIHTVHAIAVAGHWTWILPPARFTHDRTATCPSISDL
jgi:hypothetical protein